jgi:hypothetical protein
MTKFLTVKEAAEQTGKSPSSIRRIIYPIIHDDQHADRSHIEPTNEQVQDLRMKGENFAWRLSEELLAREIGAKAPEVGSIKSTPLTGVDPSLRELVALLRDQLQQSHEQLTVKDQQISSLTDLTKSLNDRLREGNILMGSLQQQFALPAGKPRVPSKDSSKATSPNQPSRNRLNKRPRLPRRKASLQTSFADRN